MKKANPLTAIVSSAVFIISGVASAYLFHENGGQVEVGMNQVLPGLLFVFTCVCTFLIMGIKLDVGKVLMFSLLEYLTYLIVFFITLYTSVLGIVIGIILCGVGALVTFTLTDRFIKKIAYVPRSVFLLGGLGFLINLALLLESVSAAIKPLYEIQGSVYSSFTPAILFWQVIVGIKFSFTLAKHTHH